MDAPAPGRRRLHNMVRLALLAGALLAGALLGLYAKPVNAQEVPAQTLDASLLKTVGTTPGVCAPAGNSNVDVAPGDTVYICYTLTNTGSVPLEPFDLIDNFDNPANSVAVPWDKPPGFVLEPGAMLEPTTTNGLIRAVTVDATITGNAGWGVAAADGSQTRQITSNDVTINVVSLGVNATLTGLGSQITIPSSQCTSPSVTLSSYQSSVYLCVTLTNASSITLTQHHVSIPGFGIDFVVDKPLGPSGTTSSTIRITSTDSGATAMAPKLSAPTVTSRAYITSTNATSSTAASLSVSAITEPVVVTGPAASVQMQKMINTVPDPCGSSSTLNNVSYGQTFYYCLILINSASLTYTDHVFTEPALKIAGSFNAELRPGGRITVTNNYLSGLNVTPFLGPFTATTSINTTMAYTASNPGVGYRAVTSASSSVSVLTPTPTNTGAPTPTNTPIPFDTPISPPTFTPIPATPTPTWTWTPSPTPTPSPTVLIFSTPGGVAPTPYPTLAGMPAGMPPGVQASTQPNQFVSPLDPLAATTQAQTAFSTPVLDPFGATATAQAQFTFPTPVLDPFGATATAQAQFAFPTPVLDPFGATATAQTQSAFTSPLIDPFSATGTAEAQLALSAPLPDALAATATAQIDSFVATALAQAATVTAAVGNSQLAAASATALALAVVPPGQYITVTATFTPEPPSGPTQRPVEQPTPGPTVDARSFFVRVLDSAGATVALLWFLGGSVLFFITAGVLAGLSFRAKEQARFALEPAETEAPYTVHSETGTPETPETPPNTSKADDNWPESLP